MKMQWNGKKSEVAEKRIKAAATAARRQVLGMVGAGGTGDAAPTRQSRMLVQARKPWRAREALLHARDKSCYEGRA